jgi:hypothetical protein
MPSVRSLPDSAEGWTWTRSLVPAVRKTRRVGLSRAEYCRCSLSGTTELATNDTMLRTFDATTSEAVQYMIHCRCRGTSRHDLPAGLDGGVGLGRRCGKWRRSRYRTTMPWTRPSARPKEYRHVRCHQRSNHGGAAITIAGTPAEGHIVCFRISPHEPGLDDRSLKLRAFGHRHRNGLVT